jgi:hypothetical protein
LSAKRNQPRDAVSLRATHTTKNNFRISEITLDAWIETAIERFGLVPLEGRFAIVTDAGRDAMDADVLLTNSAGADGEIVWF